MTSAGVRLGEMVEFLAVPVNTFIVHFAACSVAWALFALGVPVLIAGSLLGMFFLCVVCAIGVYPLIEVDEGP